MLKVNDFSTQPDYRRSSRAVERGCKTLVFKKFFFQKNFKNLKSPNCRFLKVLKKKNLKNPDFRLTYSHSRKYQCG